MSVIRCGIVNYSSTRLQLFANRDGLTRSIGSSTTGTLLVPAAAGSHRPADTETRPLDVPTLPQASTHWALALRYKHKIFACQIHSYTTITIEDKLQAVHIGIPAQAPTQAPQA